MKKIFNILLISLVFTSLIGEFIILDFRNYFSNKPRSYTSTIKSIDSLYSIHKRDKAFFNLAGKYYSKGINYSWGNNQTEIPFWKNYILYLFSKSEKALVNLKLLDSNSNRFSKFESSNYKISLGRGFGICSQNSLGFSDLLNDRYNINTKIVGLNGHVVIYYKDDQLEMFIDPSLGISFETNYSVIDNQLSSIQSMYNKTNFPDLAITYDLKGNNMPVEYGINGYRPNLIFFECILNILKYCIPLLILFFINFNSIRRVLNKNT